MVCTRLSALLASSGTTWYSDLGARRSKCGGCGTISLGDVELCAGGCGTISLGDVGFDGAFLWLRGGYCTSPLGAIGPGGGIYG